MILAQNHQRQLNGSNLIYLLCGLLILALASCSGTKNMSDKNKVLKPSGKDKSDITQKGSGKVDTVFWTEVDRSKEYNSIIEDLDLEKKDSYKVSLLFPFDLSHNNHSDVNNSKTQLGQMVNFYGGVKLALQQLEDEGINLEVEVLDSESGNFNEKLSSCINSDVIIGPRTKEQLLTTANFGLINSIPVISPWLSSSKITKDNAYFVQLKTSLKNHFNKIVTHAKTEFSDDQIFLLGRKGVKEDMSYMRYMQNVAATINNDNNRKPLQEFYIDEDSLRLGEYAFDSIFIEGKTTAFILPNHSFASDEDFVYNTARKMNGEKGLENVVLYGMPILLESDKIKYDLHRGLNMRICRASFVDRSNVVFNEFRKKYFDEYGGFPSDEALEGYDMMIFIGRSIYNYGKKFQYFLDTYDSSLLQSKFEIKKVYKDDADDRFKNIQYFQNDHLYILSFIDNKFQAR